MRIRVDARELRSEDRVNPMHCWTAEKLVLTFLNLFQTPGRIWPGKKMPGHMGNKNRTVYGAKVRSSCLN